MIKGKTVACEKDGTDYSSKLYRSTTLHTNLQYNYQVQLLLVTGKVAKMLLRQRGWDQSGIAFAMGAINIVSSKVLSRDKKVTNGNTYAHMCFKHHSHAGLEYPVDDRRQW